MQGLQNGSSTFRKDNLSAASMQNFATLQNQVGPGLQNGSSTYRKEDSYVSPLRRSIKDAQAFSTQQNVSNSGEFIYSYTDFHSVDRDKFFTTQPIEDATWPRDTTADNITKTESTVLPMGKATSNFESSRQVNNQPSIKVDDLSFDADHVENILHEMGVVRKKKIQVHNELITNFENRKNGVRPLTKYGQLGDKYDDQLSDRVVKDSHGGNKEDDEVDVNDNATRTQDLNKQEPDNKINFSSDQNLETDQIDGNAQYNSKSDEEMTLPDEEMGRKMVESEEDEGEDEEFNLGALQEAAKQGDDKLQKYIKRLSQKLHAKAAKEYSSDDSLEQSLHNKSTKKWTDDDTHARFDAGLTQSTLGKEYIGKAYANEQYVGLEKGLQSKENYHFDYDENYLFKKDNEPDFVSNRNDFTKHISQPEKSNDDHYDKYWEGIADVDHVTGSTDHVTGSTDHVTDSTHHMTESIDHLTHYQPQISQPAITSSELQELGLLDDIFKQSNINKSSANSELQEGQLLEPRMESAEGVDDLELQTHRPGQRPFSPLKNVHASGSVSKRPTDFSYVHMPSQSDNALDPISDVDTDIHLSDDSKVFKETGNLSNKHQRPKPPVIAKKPSSLRRSHHRNSSSNAQNKASHLMRPKTPERHVDGVREHHEKDRDARKELATARRGASPTRDRPDDKLLERATVSVANSSFLRGVTPEPNWEPSLSVPSLDLQDEDGDGIQDDDGHHGNEDAGGDLVENVGGEEDDNETVLMEKIANFRPSFAVDGDAAPVGGGGDAPERKGYVQVSSNGHFLVLS